MTASFQDSPSTTGDECHINIVGLTREEEGRIRKEFIKINNLKLCCSDTEQDASLEVLLQIRREMKQQALSAL